MLYDTVTQYTCVIIRRYRGVVGRYTDVNRRYKIQNVFLNVVTIRGTLYALCLEAIVMLRTAVIIHCKALERRHTLYDAIGKLTHQPCVNMCILMSISPWWRRDTCHGYPQQQQPECV